MFVGNYVDVFRGGDPYIAMRIFRDLEKFFHSGESGQWRALLGDDDLVHYEARVRQLASPELAHWIHHGYRGA